MENVSSMVMISCVADKLEDKNHHSRHGLRSCILFDQYVYADERGVEHT